MRVLDVLRPPLVAIDVGTAVTRLSFGSGAVVEQPSVVRDDEEDSLASRRAMRAGVVSDIAGVAHVVQALLGAHRRTVRRPAAVVCAPSDSNGEKTGVSVIAPDGPTVLATVLPPGMTGPRPKLSLMDLDGDRRLEVIVSIEQPRGYTNDWIFAWTGSTLALIGPLADHDSEHPHSDLTNATFLDDGSGRVLIVDQKSTDLIESDGTRRGGSVFTLYRLTNGTTSPGTPVDFFGAFCRATGTPRGVERRFSIEQPHQARDLVLINGPLGRRVTSAVVLVNGQPVARPGDFSERMSRIQIRLTDLQPENTLSVEVRGEPGALLYALIQPVP